MRRPPHTLRACRLPACLSHIDRLATPCQDHIDYLSLQALLFKQTTLGFAGQIRLLFRHSRRITD